MHVQVGASGEGTGVSICEGAGGVPVHVQVGASGEGTGGSVWCRYRWEYLL